MTNAATVSTLKSEIEKLSAIVAVDPTRDCQVVFSEIKSPSADAKTLLGWYWGLLESMLRGS